MERDLRGFWGASFGESGRVLKAFRAKSARVLEGFWGNLKGCGDSERNLRGLWEASGVIWTVTDDSVKKSECFLKGFCKNA